MYNAGFRKPTLLAATLFKHLPRQIDRQNFRATKTLRQQRGGRSRRAAQIDNNTGVDNDWLNSLEQAGPGNTVNEIRVVKSASGTIESSPYFASIKCVLGGQWRRLVSAERRVVK